MKHYLVWLWGLACLLTNLLTFVMINNDEVGEWPKSGYAVGSVAAGLGSNVLEIVEEHADCLTETD